MEREQVCLHQMLLMATYSFRAPILPELVPSGSPVGFLPQNYPGD